MTIKDEHREMLSEPAKSVRLVIQCVRDPVSSQLSYLVMIYPGPKDFPFQSGKFFLLEKLLQRLHAAIPNFDEGQLLEDSSAVQIVFAQTMQLRDTQISALALDQIHGDRSDR